MQDTEIINGLLSKNQQRAYFEKQLYLQYEYFIKEGCRKYRLSYDDSFSAYSDAVLSVIQNIINGSFDSNYLIKTYLFRIYCNKCVDLIRKITNTKHKVHQSARSPELLSHLPDTAKLAIEKLINEEEISAIKQYLDKIGENCKEILLLFKDGYTDKEIAEKLGYNNALVVKTTRSRCREKINKLFNKL